MFFQLYAFWLIRKYVIVSDMIQNKRFIFNKEHYSSMRILQTILLQVYYMLMRLPFHCSRLCLYTIYSIGGWFNVSLSLLWLLYCFLFGMVKQNYHIIFLWYDKYGLWHRCIVFLDVPRSNVKMYYIWNHSESKNKRFKVVKNSY